MNDLRAKEQELRQKLADLDKARAGATVVGPADSPLTKALSDVYQMLAKSTNERHINYLSQALAALYKARNIK